MTSGARLGAIGLVIGLVGAFAVARAMGGLLFGLSPSDPITFVIVPLVLAVVATAMCRQRVAAARLEPDERAAERLSAVTAAPLATV